MKALITFEMPKTCFECLLFSEKETYCYAVYASVPKEFYGNFKKPDFCPIEEIPEGYTVVLSKLNKR